MSDLLKQVSDLPELGVGVVYIPGLDAIVESRPDLINVVEVEPSTFWIPGASVNDDYAFDRGVVQRLLGFRQPKIVHGVGFPLGGSLFPDPRHMPALRRCVTRLSSLWASEHLSFNEVLRDGESFNTGFLLPPLQTHASIDIAARSIRKVQQFLGVPFCVETGVNYLARRSIELSDGEYTARVAEAADCGILLDLHNLWTNERNGRQSVAEFLEEVPLERIWEVHIAGGFEHKTFWIDAHSGRIAQELLDLAAVIIPRLPNLKALIFEIMPSYLRVLTQEEISNQLVCLNALWRQRHSKPPALHAASQRMERQTVVIQDVPPSEWERVLGSLAVGFPTTGELAVQLADDPGVELLRELIQEFRAGMMLDALKLTCTLVILHCGKRRLRDWMEEFWKVSPPQLFAATEARAFAQFLEDRHLPLPYLPDVLKFETAVIDSALTRRSVRVVLEHPPASIIAALKAARLPADDLASGYFEFVVPAPEIEVHSAPASE